MVKVNHKKQTGKRVKRSSGDKSKTVCLYLLPDFLEEHPELKPLAEKIASK